MYQDPKFGEFLQSYLKFCTTNMPDLITKLQEGNYKEATDALLANLAGDSTFRNGFIDLLIWLTVASREFCPFDFIPVPEDGAATTTVDHADIRGLVTACLAYVVELPLAKAGSSANGLIP
jgi:hypothetical protein